MQGRPNQGVELGQRGAVARPADKIVPVGVEAIRLPLGLRDVSGSVVRHGSLGRAFDGVPHAERSRVGSVPDDRRRATRRAHLLDVHADGAHHRGESRPESEGAEERLLAEAGFVHQGGAVPPPRAGGHAQRRVGERAVHVRDVP